MYEESIDEILVLVCYPPEINFDFLLPKKTMRYNSKNICA